jgi:hypothetical protein
MICAASALEVVGFRENGGSRRDPHSQNVLAARLYRIPRKRLDMELDSALANPYGRRLPKTFS